MIMQNPDLVERIRALGDGQAENNGDDGERERPAAAEKSETYAPKTKETAKGGRRGELLSALKPYLSASRREAIDAMLGIFDIIELVNSNRRSGG